MPRFKVAHRYYAEHNGRRFGPWERGDEVELDAVEDAEWVNRDSPGCLAPADQPKRAAAPAADRMHRGGRKRSS